MNIIDAAHMIGHDYPGGAGALAVRMGIGHVVFNNKLNPNNTTHHLTLVESLRMQQLAQRYDILFAMAEACGFICIPAEQQDSTEGVDQQLAKLCKEAGEYIATVGAAIEDGRITGAEVKRCETELSHLLNQAQAIQKQITAMRGKSRCDR